MIGANADAIKKGEDRLLFKEAMIKIGLDMPLSGVAHTIDGRRREIAAKIGDVPAHHPPRLSPWAARAAASVTTRKSSRRS